MEKPSKMKMSIPSFYNGVLYIKRTPRPRIDLVDLNIGKAFFHFIPAILA